MTALEETFALIEVLLPVEPLVGVDVKFAMKTCLWPWIIEEQATEQVKTLINRKKFMINDWNIKHPYKKEEGLSEIKD